MLHAQDEGLVRAGAGGLPVAHKIGWLDETRNDVAIVFTPGGPVVVSIFTYGTIDTTVTNFGADATRAALRAARAGSRRRPTPRSSEPASRDRHPAPPSSTRAAVLWVPRFGAPLSATASRSVKSRMVLPSSTP